MMEAITSEAEFALWLDDHMRTTGAQLGHEWAEQMAQILATKSAREDVRTPVYADAFVEEWISRCVTKLKTESIDCLAIEIWEKSLRVAFKARLTELMPVVLADDRVRQ